MYGYHYSPTKISNISKATQENVAAFHERSLEANYSVLFLDGTYLPLRRGIVSKECIHIVLGMTPEGQKAVLGYEIAPNENNAFWSTLLDKLQNQGIQQVSLVVTDGFKGLELIVSQAYPSHSKTKNRGLNLGFYFDWKLYYLRVTIGQPVKCVVSRVVKFLI